MSDGNLTAVCSFDTTKCFDTINHSIRLKKMEYYGLQSVCVCVCVYPSKRIHVAVCGPIGTTFGTRMQIHLEKVVGKIKICPVSRRGEFGGF